MILHLGAHELWHDVRGKHIDKSCQSIVVVVYVAWALEVVVVEMGGFAILERVRHPLAIGSECDRFLETWGRELRIKNISVGT